MDVHRGELIAISVSFQHCGTFAMTCYSDSPLERP
jgi:hypothetical protein